jgi:hypothetical protein
MARKQREANADYRIQFSLAIFNLHAIVSIATSIGENFCEILRRPEGTESFKTDVDCVTTARK